MITIVTVSFMSIMNFGQMVMFLCDPLPAISHLSCADTGRKLFEALLIFAYQHHTGKWYFVTLLFVLLCSVVGPGLSKASLGCLSHIYLLSLSASWSG